MSRNQFFAAAFSLAFVAGGARAQSEAACLEDLALLPLATEAAPPALQAGGSTFAVKDVRTGAFAACYTLERAAGGEAFTLEVATRGARPPAVAAGTIVSVTTTNTGAVLLAGSEAIAFVPNALGRAVLRRQRA